MSTLEPTPRAPLAERLAPNWFASVMGTGIVANAAVLLPWIGPALRPMALVVWAGSALLLVALAVLAVIQVVTRPRLARSHLTHPIRAHFLGTIPMGILVVGAGTDLVGRDLIGVDAAQGIHLVMWLLGASLGVLTAVAVPTLTVLRSDIKPEDANGTWLLTVVPPLTAASTASVLVVSVPAGEAQKALLYGSYALLGMSVVAAALMIVLIWFRLVHHDAGPVGLVPTLWIVLGPVGQSAAAAATLGLVAPTVAKGALGEVLFGVGVAFGVAMLGFAILWISIATVLTVRAALQRLPFGLSWWSFTFPVGVTCVAAAALTEATGSASLGVLSIVLYAALVAAWLLVTLSTLVASLRRGRITIPG